MREINEDLNYHADSRNQIEGIINEYQQRENDAHTVHDTLMSRLTIVDYHIRDIRQQLSSRIDSITDDLRAAPPEARAMITDEFEERVRPLREKLMDYETEFDDYRVRLGNVEDEIDAIRDNLGDLNTDLERANQNVGDRSHALDVHKEHLQRFKPLRKAYKSKMATIQGLEAAQPKLEAKRDYFQGRVDEAFDKQAKRLVKMMPHRAKAKISMEGPFGDGKPKSGGVNPHKPSADPFGDNPELEPYLTKYLRPSKFRQVNDTPAIESSSDESSGEDEPKTVKRRGGKRGKKLREDFEIIEAQLHPDKAVLIEKKTRTKRIGRGKVIETTKPAHTTAPSADLWFM